MDRSLADPAEPPPGRPEFPERERPGLPPADAGSGGHREDVPGEDQPGEDEAAEERQRKHKRHRHGLEWLVLVACSLAVALVVRAFLVQAFYIPSESMAPTLNRNDRVLVNKLSYKLHDVNRGDLIVFRAPPGAATGNVKDLIKRVIGLPGETIEGRAGAIYIDDRPLEEPYLPTGSRNRDFPPEMIPEDSYWVLGDNRLDSRDSTFFKAISEDSIVGRAFIRIWPLGEFGLL